MFGITCGILFSKLLQIKRRETDKWGWLVQLKWNNQFKRLKWCRLMTPESTTSAHFFDSWAMQLEKINYGLIG